MTTLAEHDRRIGRWRSELSPHMVVYGSGSRDWVTVWDERTMRSFTVRRGESDAWDDELEAAIAVAAEFFESHPLPSEFRAGEVWMVETPTHTAVALTDGDGFVTYANGVRVRIEQLDVVSAERIYPPMVP